MEVWAALLTVIVTGILTPIAVGYFQFYIRRNEVNAASKALAVVSDKLDTVHSLVNSRLTVVLQSLHDALAAQLAALRNNASLRDQIGHSPNAEANAVISALERRITKLSELIADRGTEDL